MKTYYFTFGTNHFDSKGDTLANNYVAIKAETEFKARAEMFEVRGDRWAFNYEFKEFERQIEEFGLTEKSLLEVFVNLD